MHGKIPRLAALLLGSTVASTTMGCGSPAAPQPPSLNLPIPVLNLSAVRRGNSVHLAWTMPNRTTDRVALVHPIAVEVCRALERGPCARVGSLLVAPGGAETYSDELPADLTQGTDRLLRYEVALKNHAGKSAGPSNAAYSAAGASPPALVGLSGRVQANGVELSWQPAPEVGKSVDFRIERLQLTIASTEPVSRSPLAPAAPAAAQTLAVHGVNGSDPGHARDASALFNQRYQYVVERVATLTLGGETVEVQGLPSGPVAVATTDIFPPAVPQGLVAVADAGSGAIDLSWTPNTESDLAEYHLYRRDTQGGLPAQRISSLMIETSFRDTGLQPGHTYGYSLSALDQTGNESQRSPEVEESLPVQTKEPASR